MGSTSLQFNSVWASFGLMGLSNVLEKQGIATTGVGMEKGFEAILPNATLVKMIKDPNQKGNLAVQLIFWNYKH